MSKERTAMKCPTMGIYCYLDWCCSNGMCKQQKAYTVDDKGKSHPIEEGKNASIGSSVTTTLWCEKYQSHCGQAQCIAKGSCFYIAASKPATATGVPPLRLVGEPKKFRVCPAVPAGEPNNCVDPDCLKQDRCLDVAYGAADYTRNYNEKFACPVDHKSCEMVSCDQGKNCFMRRQALGKTGTTYLAPCHEGLYSLGFINKAEIVVGKEATMRTWDVHKDGKVGLIIGLLGDAFPQGSIIGFNEKAKSAGFDKELAISTPVAPNIWIKWPDFGTVPFDRAWWLRLIKIISEQEGAVLLYCYGGHGRTGTAASIICALSGLCADGDPVAWVRGKYCDHAVENGEQVQYIEQITGRKVEAIGFKETNYWSSKSGVGDASKGHDGKKRHGGHSSSKPKANKRDDKFDKENILSKKKWKAWWRRQSKVDSAYQAIKDVTRPENLPDGQTFVIGKTTWQWRLAANEFHKIG